MPIPDERMPRGDESDEDALENERAEQLSEDDELEFESADADNADDAMLEPGDASEPDVAGFGYGDPAE
jgi:hypothetical protein